MISRSTDIQRALRARQRQRGLLNPFFLGAGGGSAATAILAALRSWWSLDENAATPTYADSHGSNNLTQRNAAGNVNTSVHSSVSALLGRSWNANNTDDLAIYCPRSNTGLDAIDADFSFGGWFKTATIAATFSPLMGRFGGTTIATDALLAIDSAGNITFTISTDGTFGSTIIANSGVGPSTTQYSLIIGSYDKTAGFVRIRNRPVGGGVTKVSTALSGGTVFTGSIASNFCLGDGLDTDANFTTLGRNGVQFADECFYVNKAFTDADFDYFYNAGVGKTYANLVADA